ncbi:hypothetical protein BYT27DRAFT_6399103 [Phlegmacium glaucopus]|nr:hypothetical protein BYT27DRAFT_6399103 [Phlegmacium glaucopus]
MAIGAYYPKREVSANPGVPREHIITQAEAQRSQQLAIQQAKETGASTGSSSSCSPQQERSTLSQTATQGNHVQIALPPASSLEGLNIQHYQPTQQVRHHLRALRNGLQEVAQITPILLHHQVRVVILECPLNSNEF